MIRIDFSEEEIEAFKYARFYHPHPRVRRKMEALLLKSKKISHEQICQIVDISANTLRAYLRSYIDGGIDKLKEINFYQQKSELVAHKITIENYLRANPPATIQEAIAEIEKITGLKRSPTQTRKFLKTIGMKRLKVGTIPSKADPDKQEDFKKKL